MTDKVDIVAILSMSDKEIEDAIKIVSASEKVLLFHLAHYLFIYLLNFFISCYVILVNIFSLIDLFKYGIVFLIL